MNETMQPLIGSRLKLPPSIYHKEDIMLPQRNLFGRDLMYKSMYVGKVREASPEQRMAAADILNAHLLMVEIMMSTIMQLYIFKVRDALIEQNRMRHNIKRHINALYLASLDLQRRCNAHDSSMVETFCRNIYPSLVEIYKNSDGSLTSKLQSSFYKNYQTQLDLIYFSTKNAIDKARIPDSSLASNVQMISMLANTGIEFYNLMCKKVDGLLDGFGRVARIKSQHNEKILCSAKELLRELCSGRDLPEKESEDARKLAAQFQKELTGEGLLQMMEGSIISLQTDFIEFCIASIRMKIHEKKMLISDIRTLLARLGSMKNVRKLLEEIEATPLSEENEFDMIDLAQSLPNSLEGSALCKYRRLMLEDHVLLPEKEDEKIVRQRELRQEARSNNGKLPDGTLKQLFAELGTKKAVQDLITSAGPELNRTAIIFRGMKVSQLK